MLPCPEAPRNGQRPEPVQRGTSWDAQHPWNVGASLLGGEPGTWQVELAPAGAQIQDLPPTELLFNQGETEAQKVQQPDPVPGSIRMRSWGWVS